MSEAAASRGPSILPGLGRLGRILRGSGRALRKNPNMALGFVLVAAVTLMALIAPLITHYDPSRLNVADRLFSPSPSHWFGTDHLGRDVYTRGRLWRQGVPPRRSVGGGIHSHRWRSAGPCLRILPPRGLRSHAFHGRLARLPSFLLAIAMVAAWGAGVGTVILAISLVTTPYTARLARASVLSLREVDYVMAARAIGVGPFRTMLLHILPNMVARSLYRRRLCLLSPS